MNDVDTKEHQRATDPNERTHYHRRRTDVGIRGWVRRNLSVLSYIILALAIAWSLNSVRNEGSKRRSEIIAATQQVIQDSCERGNQTRQILRSLILDSDKQAKRYLDEHLLNPTQYQRAIEANQKAAEKLTDVDCDAAVKKNLIAAQAANEN